MQQPEFNAYALSNGEILIKQYRCAEVKPFLSRASNAFLDLTNKRVIYSSDRSGRSTKSKLLGEMPLQEVSGINVSYSQAFNILHLLVFIAGAYMLNSALAELLPFIFESIAFGILFSFPYLVFLIFKHQLLNPEVEEKLKRQVAQSEMGVLIQNKGSLHWEQILRILFGVGLSILVWAFAHSQSIAELEPFLSLFFLLMGYCLIYLLCFPHSKEFQLTIGSRNAGTSSISIRTSLFKAMGDRLNTGSQGKLVPGEDAETLARELGAIILDLQQMGDLGVQKWTSN